MKLPSIRRRSKKTKALGAARSTPAKAIGAVALIGALAAAVARRLKGGGEPDPFAGQVYEPADAAAATNGGAAPPEAPEPAVEPDAAVEEPEVLAAEEATAEEPEAAPEEPEETPEVPGETPYGAEKPADTAAAEPAAEDEPPPDEPEGSPGG